MELISARIPAAGRFFATYCDFAAKRARCSEPAGVMWHCCTPMSRHPAQRSTSWP
jgi:hypothetical protein